MSSTGAIRAQATLSAMIIEISLSELTHSLIERIVNLLFIILGNLMASTGIELICSIIKSLLDMS